MEEKEWLTVTEAMQLLGMTESTLRRYIRDHKMFLNTKKESEGSPLEIHVDSLEVLELVRNLRDQKKWKRQQIDSYLRAHKPMIIKVNEEEVLPEPTSWEVFTSMRSTIQKMEERQKRLEENQAKLLAFITEHGMNQSAALERIETSLNRDKHRKKGFWRWFGK